MAENLVKRKGVYYARVAAPLKLKSLRRAAGVKGKNDVWRTLDTKDLATAKRVHPAVLQGIYRDFDAEIAELSGQGASDLRWARPTAQEIERAIVPFIQEELALDEQVRTSWPSPEDIEKRKLATLEAFLKDPPTTDLERSIRPGGLSDFSAFVGKKDLDQERRQVLAATLKEHLASQNFALIDWAVWDHARRNHWDIDKGSVEYKALARTLMRGWLSALKTSFERDEGVYKEPATVTPLAPTGSAVVAANAADKPKKGESLRDYLDAYLKEQKQHLKASARQDRQATVRQFIECSGDRAVSTYTRGDMAKFKRLLGEAPARAEKLYPGVPLPKAVERNKRDNNPRLRSNSIRNKLSTMAAFGAWLESNVPGVDALNFTTTLPPKTDAERMEPFSSEDIGRILNAPAFTGCRSERDQQSPGEYKIHDWRLWLPLIAAFTGARLNEITQLTVNDVEQVEGIWVFRITDAGTRQSLKNANSRRLIPVHPTLIDLGLLKFRQTAVHLGASDLFHEIQVDQDGRRSHHAGKWFRKFIERIGVKRSEDLGGAHRWRHTLADALRRGGVEDYQIAQVLGHKIDIAKMTGHYGREVTMSLKTRLELLSRAEYPSVDFALLVEAAKRAPDAHE